MMPSVRNEVEPLTNERQLALEPLIASEMPGSPPCPLGLGPHVSQPLAPPRLGKAGEAPIWGCAQGQPHPQLWTHLS